MRVKFLTCFLIATMTVVNTWSQQAIIRGRINDIINRESLAGATVSVKGSANSTVTDVNGEFSFYVNPTNLQLDIRYLGYRDTTINVNIKVNEFKILNIGLVSDYAQLSSIIVTGFLQGQAKALNQQKMPIISGILFPQIRLADFLIPTQRKHCSVYPVLISNVTREKAGMYL